MTAAVTVEGISKRFRLYHEKYTSLKERAIHLGRMPYEEFWALRDVNMEIKTGETVGILGHNGSGKSTLLKCIAAILAPTHGRILVRGSLAAMLEIGAGFHQDLSGRDNVYLNASLLGMARRDIDRRFDEIVAFAELEDFIDNQVKYYSSGMYARLGFAVAVTFEPDVLLVDEVLAVGDENFQRKCLDRMRHFQDEGRTIIVVSHSPDMVRTTCGRAFVLHRGQLVGEGPPGEAIRTYRQHLLAIGEDIEGIGQDEDNADRTEAALRPRSRKVRITSVDVEYPDQTRPYLLPGEALGVKMGFVCNGVVDDAIFGIAIYDLKGDLVYGSNTELLDQYCGPISGFGYATFRFDSVPLLDGTYGITLGIESSGTGEVYDWSEQRHHFEVMAPGRSVGAVDLAMRTEVVSELSRSPGQWTASQ